MARTPNKFIDPKGDRATYEWAVNHLTEDQGVGKSRNMQRTAPTGEVGLNRQQGDPNPTLLALSGTMLTKAQHDETIAWYGLCDSQTIYFEDFSGQQAEVIVTSFIPKRRAVARNLRDLANAPLWVYDYTIEMEVLRWISGPWAGVAA